jgi:hypothetical protein
MYIHTWQSLSVDVPWHEWCDLTINTSTTPWRVVTAYRMFPYARDRWNSRKIGWRNEWHMENSMETSTKEYKYYHRPFSSLVVCGRHESLEFDVVFMYQWYLVRMQFRNFPLWLCATRIETNWIERGSCAMRILQQLLNTHFFQRKSICALAGTTNKRYAIIKMVWTQNH